MVEQATLRRPVDPFAHALHLTRSALAALRRGDYSTGERLLRAAIRHDPALAEAWLWLGALKHGARRSICLRWARLTYPEAEIPALHQLHNTRSGSLPRASWALQALAGGFATAVLAVGLFQVRYADRVYPGVSALGHALQGQEPRQASAELQPAAARWAGMPVVLKVGEARWPLPMSRLGRFEPEALALRAYRLGRAGPLVARLADQAGALFSPSGLAVMPPLAEQQVARAIEELSAAAERRPQPARFVQGASGWRIVPGRDGLALDQDAARSALRAAWAGHSWGAQPAPLAVELQLRRLPASPGEAELRPHLAQLRYQTAEPLDLVWDGGSLRLDRAELLDLSALPERGQPFSADSAAVASLLRRLQAQIDRPMQRSRLVREGNYVRDFALGIAGRRLDSEAAEASIVAALQAGARAVELPVEIAHPPPGEAEALGLTAEIGQGSSQFTGHSAADRDQNVLIGGREFDGLLIPPGGVLSATETIGSITWEKGYRWGHMISGGQLVPSLGGGVCQVSTSLFRAAFWSGLEIIERHNHQLRLPWYELDAPAGMDAAIAIGGPDLKIRNNTGRHILISVTTDLQRQTQRFTLYGTPPGWTVERLGPRRQGGAIVIGRRVSKDGRVILRDSFSSYYIK